MGLKVDDLDAPQVPDLLGRVCFALGPDGARGHIIDAYLARDSLFVRGPKEEILPPRVIQYSVVQ